MVMRATVLISAVSATVASAIAAGAAAAATPQPMAELTPTATLPTGKQSSWAEVSPDAVWVASLQPYVLHRIDSRTNREVAKVDLPGNPCSGLAAGLGALWVPLCGATPSLAKIDLATNTISAVFKVGPAAGEGGVAVSADSVWLITDKAGSLARVNPQDGSVRQVIHLPADSYNPIYSDGVIWVTQAKNSSVTAVDGASGQIRGSVQTGLHPRFLTAGAGSIWTLNAGDGTVSQINARKRSLTRTIPLGIQARGGDIKYGDGEVWITLFNTPLSAIDAKSGKLRCQWTGAGGDSMAVGHGSVWISNGREQTLTRFDIKSTLQHCQGG